MRPVHPDPTFHMNPFTRQRETPASVALVPIGAGSIDPLWSSGFDSPSGLGALLASANRFASRADCDAGSPSTALLECAWGDDDDEDDDFDFLDDDDDDELDEDEDDDAEEEEEEEEDEELEEGEETEEAEEAEEDEDLLEDDEEEEEEEEAAAEE